MRVHLRLLGILLFVGAVGCVAHATFPAATSAIERVEPSSAPIPSERPEGPGRVPSLLAAESPSPSQSPWQEKRHRRHRRTRHHARHRRGSHHAHRHRKRHAPHPQASQSAAKVEINRATLSQLEALPGVDHALALHIIALREAGGGFDDPDDLLDVAGVTPGTLSHLMPLLQF